MKKKTTLRIDAPSAFADRCDASNPGMRTPLLARRNVLGWLSGGAALAGLPTLVSCGGGGGAGGGFGVGWPSTDPAGGGDNSNVISDEQRFDVLRRVALKGAELRTGRTRLAFVQALATYMSTLPEYTATGVDEDTLCAWALFRDGRMQIVAANRNAIAESDSLFAEEPADAGPTATSTLLVKAQAELPLDATARVLHSFGASADRQPTVTALKQLLVRGDYTVRDGVQGDARVSTLREVKGDGFFFINTHGGASPQIEFGNASAPALYSLQSSTQMSPELERLSEFKEDFKAWRLTYFNGDIFDDQPDGTATTQWRYGITANFVDAYWRFSKNAVVFINACASARTASAKWAGAFMAACHRQGAGVYVGWSNIVSPTGADAAPRYFVDRMLGTNAVDPELEPQRAFPWDLVLNDMRKSNRHIDPNTQAELLAVPNPNSASTHILTPSIEHLEVSESTNELRLHGSFGTVQGAVEVDGARLPIVKWEPNLVRCALPPVTQPGAHGKVIASLGPRKSNTRWLSLWTVEMSYHERSPLSGDLRIDGKATLHLRADVGKVRSAPGGTPALVPRHAQASRDSAFKMTASGSFLGIGWSGTMNFVAMPGPTERVLSCGLLIHDEGDFKGALGLERGLEREGGFTASYPPPQPSTQFTAQPGQLDGTKAFPQELPSGDYFPEPLTAFNFNFGPDYTIPGRTHTDPYTGATFRWNDTKPRYAPQRDDAT